MLFHVFGEKSPPQHKDKLICIEVRFNDHKYGILNKNPSLKGIRIFINEDLIPEDQVELRKKDQRLKEVKKEGKWEIIRNRKTMIRD